MSLVQDEPLSVFESVLWLTQNVTLWFEPKLRVRKEWMLARDTNIYSSIHTHLDREEEILMETDKEWFEVRQKGENSCKNS